MKSNTIDPLSLMFIGLDELSEEPNWERDYNRFLLEVVVPDPVLYRIWRFCFAIDSKKPLEDFFRSRLESIRQNEITKDDLFYLNRCANKGDPALRIFFQALGHFAYLITRVVTHWDRARMAGYDPPTELLLLAHSHTHREETNRVVRETDFIDLPDFIKVYTRKTDKGGNVKEDLCLIPLGPVEDKDKLKTELHNYFERYTVELYQKSRHSHDITFLCPPQRRKKASYSLSLEIQGKKTELIKCQLGQKYAGLLKTLEKKLDYQLKQIPGGNCLYEKKSHDRMVPERPPDAQQEILGRFCKLLKEYDPSRHGFLAGYLKSGLQAFVVDMRRQATAKKRKLKEPESDGSFAEPKPTPDGDQDHHEGFPIDEIITCKEILEKLSPLLSHGERRVLRLIMKNPEETEGRLAEELGISVLMVKKHKRLIRMKARKLFPELCI